MSDITSESVPAGTQVQLQHRDITEKIIRVFYDVYNELGHGFLESVYEDAMCIALVEAGLLAERQVAVPVCFRGRKLSEFRADVLVEGKVLVELKVAKSLDSSHYAQVMHYLKATPLEVAILLNFGSRPEFKRLVFANERKQIRVHPRESAVGFGL